MATTLEIINGISQALARKHDGALDEDGEKIEIGLRREEGDPLIDSRVIDGFSAHCKGNRLCISYHSEVPLKEVHNSSFESEIESMVEKVKSFIQKEFRKVTGSSLSLSDPTECDVLVEYVSRIRTSVKAYKTYKIGGIDAEPIHSENATPKLDKAIKDWISLGKNSKKAKNDTRTKKGS